MQRTMTFRNAIVTHVCTAQTCIMIVQIREKKSCRKPMSVSNLVSVQLSEIVASYLNIKVSDQGFRLQVLVDGSISPTTL